jgi:hypothetical protein
MGFKRKASRVETGRDGRLQRGSLSAPCKVLDVSETGVRIESRVFVKTGDALQLVIELERGRTLTCGLQVVHVRTPNNERLAHILDDNVQTSFSRR